MWFVSYSLAKTMLNALPMRAQKVSRTIGIHWANSLQYRVDLFMWTFAGLIASLLPLVIWYTVSTQSESGPGSSQVLAYYVVLIFTASATDSWHAFYVVTDILKGDIVKHLIRPFPYIWQPITNNIAEKSIKLPLLFCILLVLLIFFPALPKLIGQHIAHPFLFIISLTLALVIAFTLDTAIGFTAFWLEDAGEIIRYKFLFAAVAAGTTIPYAFMPTTLVQVLSFLPFRYMFSAPVEILLGQTAGTSLITLLAAQSVWAMLLIMLCLVLWKKGLQRYAVPGQ